MLVLCLMSGLSAWAAVADISEAVAAEPGSFARRDGRWAYTYEDGSFASDCLLLIDGRTYLFSEDGYRLSGWQTIGSDRYYFGTDDEGYLYKNRWLVT